MITNTATVETTQSVHAVATTPDDVFSHMTAVSIVLLSDSSTL